MASARYRLSLGKWFHDLVFGDRRLLTAAFGQALSEALRRWQAKTLPKHFEFSAYQRYPGAYAARTRPYEIYKARKTGQRGPMVFSGKMRDTLLNSTPPIETIERSNKVSATLRLFENKMNFWGAGRKHDFAQSLSAINASELRDIEAFIRQRAEQLLIEGTADDEPVIVGQAA